MNCTPARGAVILPTMKHTTGMVRALALGGALAGTLFITTGSVGCGSDGDAKPDARAPWDARPGLLPELLPDPLPTGAQNVKVATINTGLLQTVKGAPERLPVIIEAVKALDADIICLQELYNATTNPKDFATAVAAEFPYSWWNLDRVNGEGNGLAVVSKVPLYRGRFVRFEKNDTNNLVDRGVLGVTAVKDGEWYAHIVCAHMNANLDEEGNGIRLSQVAEIKDLAMEEGYLSGPSFFLADMNAGPMAPSNLTCECEVVEGTCTPECQPADTGSYDAVRESWTDSNAAMDDCTQCRDQLNAMAVLSIFDREPSQRLDHCMHNNLSGGAGFKSSNFVLDEPQTIVDGNGEPVPFLSDHKGLRCVYGL